MGEKKPEIRFQGYNDEWEEKDLGELSESFEYGLNAAAKEYDGINKYIRITDIDDESRQFKMSELTSPNTNINMAEKYKLKTGDILFARTGASVGKTYIYNDNDGLVYYAGFLIRARTKKEFNSYFIFQNTLTEKYNKFIRLTSQRSGQPGVNAQEYSEYKIIIPSPAEQSQIGIFFQKIDTLISLRQKKLEKLKNTKKAFLNKMFPKEGSDVPEIRFEGFSGKWERMKLKDISLYFNGGSFEKDINENGRFELVTLKSVDMSGNLVSSGRFVDVQVPTLNKGTLVMILSEQSPGLLGMTAQIPTDDKYILNQRVAEIRPNERIDSYFLSMAININQKYFSSRGAGTKVQNITKSNVENYEIMCPSKTEQTKIGNFFQTLDRLIGLQEKEIEKLKELKKAFLEKMFV